MAPDKRRASFDFLRTGLGFQAVDSDASPGELISHLDGASANPVVRARKRLMYDMMRLAPGMEVLDAGCGVGTDLFEMAKAVAPDGRAVGVDLSEVFVAETRRRAAAGGVKVDVRQADLATLPFPGAAFDAAHSERVLLHVEDPSSVLAELARVIRTGGRLAVADLDYDLGCIDLPDRDVVRQIDAWRSDIAHRNGWIGRQLPRLFLQAGFRDIEVQVRMSTTLGSVSDGSGQYRTEQYRSSIAHARDAGYVTAEQAERHVAAVDAAVAAGTWFSASGVVIVNGVRG